jgi:hypothetical protein
MRPRRSNERWRHAARAVAIAVVAAGGLVASARTARAQGDLAQEGALFLLLPVGARAVGVGQAVVAARPGSEAVWWNPSALARASKREIAIHHSQSIIGTGDAVSIVIPSSLLGVLTASVNILDYGEQANTPDSVPIGSILPRSFVLAGTYSTTIGSLVSAGITYKVVQFRVDCTGPCTGVPTFKAATSALDLGAQFEVSRKIPLTFGIAARNIGVRLQVNDNPQSDPIPGRLQAGVHYRLDIPDKYARNLAVGVEFDQISELSLDNPSSRFGVDVEWESRAHFRAGYAADSPNGSKVAAGLGLLFGRFSLDLARGMSGLSVDAGQAPTYLSLRYEF